MLLTAIVGSGIMGERLAAGNIGIALLANSLATGAALIVLILIFGPISGAHFNPAVTLYFAVQRDIVWRDAGAYIVVQILGGLAGAVLAHPMFELPWLEISNHARTGPGQWVG